MANSSKNRKRKLVRLPGYDYSKPGKYFITICTKDRECLFGYIENGEMIWNDAGVIVNECWLKIPEHYPNVVLHNHIVMPNHLHGIIEITADVQPTSIVEGQNIEFQQLVQSPKKHQFQKIIPRSVGSMVRGYKIGVVKWFRQNTEIYNPWQRNFHEHIIRNEDEYIRISIYIRQNASKWKEDRFYKK